MTVPYCRFLGCIQGPEKSVHRHIFWIAANTWPVRAGTMNGGATRTPSADAKIVCKSRGSAMRIDNSAMLRAVGRKNNADVSRV